MLADGIDGTIYQSIIAGLLTAGAATVGFVWVALHKRVDRIERQYADVAERLARVEEKLDLLLLLERGKTPPSRDHGENYRGDM